MCAVNNEQFHSAPHAHWVKQVRLLGFNGMLSERCTFGILKFLKKVGGFPSHVWNIFTNYTLIAVNGTCSTNFLDNFKKIKICITLNGQHLSGHYLQYSYTKYNCRRCHSNKV